MATNIPIQRAMPVHRTESPRTSFGNVETGVGGQTRGAVPGERKRILLAIIKIFLVSFIF